MTLHLFNTLSRRQEIFTPQDPAHVKMYVCGVTVYDLCHLGHARAYVVWDTVRRYLNWRGYSVTYVQNFTDVDDKILRRAVQEGSSMTEVVDRYIAAYFEDMDRLNILRADLYPRATQSLQPMFELIESLQTQHFAYQVKSRLSGQGQDVYYSVRQFADYGQLSGRKREEMQAGASGRVGEEESDKQDPFDFALWKSVPLSEPGFESPWGWGRPGWHLECSAMVKANLGNSIDIHAGGADLIFPHHENELAQSEPVTGKPFARYWMHNGFVNINGEKMSKSLGNFTTLRDAMKVYDPMALRLFFLQTHYRNPVDLTDEAMVAASHGWATLLKGILAAHQFCSAGEDTPAPERMTAFQTAMDNDFSTPEAVALAFDLAKELGRERNLLLHQGQPDRPIQDLARDSQTLLDILTVLGLSTDPALSTEDEPLEGQISEDQIQQLADQRRAAKKARDFKTSDRIRAELKDLGITLVDQPDGSTRWFRS